jgi:hypothetical protein
MSCIPEAKELLSDCTHCHDDHQEEHRCNPLFDIASPIEGQTLEYNETFKKFINIMKPSFTIVNGNLQITIEGVVYNVNLTAA